MQLITLVLSSIAFATAVQGATPQICCPKTARNSIKGSTTNFKGGSMDSDGNLVCSYEGRGYDDSENPFCRYTPIQRQSTTQPNPFEKPKTYTYKPGESLPGGKLICDHMSPPKGPASAACTSEFCCPPGVFGALKNATYQKKSGQDTFWCGYAADKGCEYYADSGKLTFTYYHGACPAMADTGKTCVINQ